MSNELKAFVFRGRIILWFQAIGLTCHQPHWPRHLSRFYRELCPRFHRKFCSCHYCPFFDHISFSNWFIYPGFILYYFVISLFFRILFRIWKVSCFFISNNLCSLCFWSIIRFFYARFCHILGPFSSFDKKTISIVRLTTHQNNHFA